MDYILKEDPQTDYLRIILEGEWNSDRFGEIADGILGFCEKHQARKILMDVRGLTGNPSALSRFTMATHFTTKYLKARVAHRIPPCHFAVIGQDPLVDPKRFEENVAVNIGLPVRTFTALDKALAWLKEQKGPNS